MYTYWIEEFDCNIQTYNPISSGDCIILSEDNYIISTVTHTATNTVISVKKKRKTKRFKKPTQEEVDAFANESNLQQDGFFDYFESNGWKRGKNPMKDWKAALRGWSRRNNDFNKKSSPIGLGDPNMEF